MCNFNGFNIRFMMTVSIFKLSHIYILYINVYTHMDQTKGGSKLPNLPEVQELLANAEKDNHWVC